METYGIEKLGIVNPKAVYRNLTPAQLTEAALRRGEGKLSNTGALVVTTGKYTGRSPKDKFIVMDENSKDTVWWTSDEYKNDNHPASQEAWDTCKELAIKELSNKRLFVVDAFCGAKCRYTYGNSFYRGSGMAGTLC